MLSRCSSLVLEYDDNNVNIVISSSMIGELRQAWEHTLIECWETTHLFILSKERGNFIPLLIEAAKLAPSAEHSFSRAAQCVTTISQLSVVTRPYVKLQVSRCSRS